MSAKYKVFVVPHTHWDRAWYLPFEEFRIRLVDLVDRLCDTLEKDPAFTAFCLDGQTVVLEDYLAVRPQMADRLKRLVTDGRLAVGPWYVLPDEFIVSAESIVRNLMLGHRISGEFGHTMAVGYVPDPFGHIAQLPQILKGFGLDSFIFTRGIDAQTTELKPEFTWRALDGSPVLAIRQPWGYGNAANLGYWLGWGYPERMELDKKLAVKQIEGVCRGLSSVTLTKSLLLGNGWDHAVHQPELPKLLTMAAKKMPEHAFRIASFEDYVKSVKRDLRGKRLQSFTGELYYDYGDMLHGVYSSRMYLKIANQECEDLLEKKAEPLSALAWATKSGTYPIDLLWCAWRELLKNHPHDDICGCSVNQVHTDMKQRFGVAKQVGEVVVRDGLRSIARNLDNTKQDGVPIMVFNPLGVRRKEVVNLPIDLSHAHEPWKRFALFDEAGREVPYELLGSEDVFWMETLRGFDVRRHTVSLKLDLPPLGYRTLYARPVKRSRPVSSIKMGPRSFENKFYRLSIATDGSIRLTDKATKQRYTDLLVFEDAEDCGDGYNWSYLKDNSETFTTAHKRARVKLVHADAFSATWRIAHKLRVPASLTSDRKARSKETVTLEIVSDVTCKVGSPRVNVVTRIDNNVKDHRVRALFPTAIKTDEVNVDGHFAVLNRTVKMPPPKGDLPPYPTQHVGRFADLSDGKKGFAIINLGMPEFEVVCKRTRRILAQTLFRSVDQVSRNDHATRRGHCDHRPRHPRDNV